MAKSIELPLVGIVTTEEIRETYKQLKQEGKKGVFIQTLGCQMNEHDTEKMLGLLKTLDYEPVQSILAADLILYNTCAVRENPERKLYGQINTLINEHSFHNGVSAGFYIQATCVVEGWAHIVILHCHFGQRA
jgi:hypothetical protein